MRGCRGKIRGGARYGAHMTIRGCTKKAAGKWRRFARRSARRTSDSRWREGGREGAGEGREQRYRRVADQTRRGRQERGAGRDRQVRPCQWRASRVSACVRRGTKECGSGWGGSSARASREARPEAREEGAVAQEQSQLTERAADPNIRAARAAGRGRGASESGITRKRGGGGEWGERVDGVVEEGERRGKGRKKSRKGRRRLWTGEGMRGCRGERGEGRGERGRRRGGRGEGGEGGEEEPAPPSLQGKTSESGREVPQRHLLDHLGP